MYEAALEGQEQAAYWRRGGGMGTTSPTTHKLLHDHFHANFVASEGEAKRDDVSMATPWGVDGWGGLYRACGGSAVAPQLA